MDWSLFAGISALIGVLCNFIRMGEWKARQETKVDNLEKRMDAFERSIGELLRKNDVQTQLLTELKVKLDLMFEDKAKRREEKSCEGRRYFDAGANRVGRGQRRGDGRTKGGNSYRL